MAKVTGARFEVLRLVRSELLEMAGYEPVEPTDLLAERLGIAPEQVVKLDGNESPYGPSPEAVQALAGFGRYHIYPDPEQRKVRHALADYLGVGEKQIVAGAGSDELIDLLLRAVISPGEGVLNCTPTFGMYAFSTAVCGGRVIEVPRREDFSLDLPGIKSAAGQAKVIFVASPNNPSGNLMSRRELDALLGSDLLVVVDEAYGEFAGESVAPLAPQRGNLVVLRTFSKWAGLAGLRAGYGVFPAPLAALLMRIKPPYNLNVAAQAAMLASLEDRGRLMEGVRATVEERERLAGMLEALEFIEVLPSRANFLLCRLQGLDAREVRERLARRGIFVRHFDMPRLRDCLRITVGLPSQSEPLVSALREIGAELGR